MSAQVRENILADLRSMGKESFRVVALAMKKSSDDTTLENVTFIGMMAIRDRIRKEVPSAIKRVSDAGVGVVMITGDNVDTATSIAKECGIISSFGNRKTVVTGSELAVMTDKEISDIMPALAVVARALPSDKSRLVRIAQEKGLVVGMTGDGINDSSSLKTADVGFAMGSGTDVAKEASDIIISDNNFASIVKAILYGRTIFESIRKFIVFQLTMNLAAVGISLIGPFIGIENPVTVTQMLWVNIIMDTLGALAFASEPADEVYMKKKPKTRDENLISTEMMHQIIGTGLYVLCVSVWFLKSKITENLFYKADERYVLSAFFAMFIFMGVFVCFSSRTPRLNIMANISKNKSFILIMLLISVMQTAFIYFGGETFRATPLYLKDLFYVIFISFTVIIFDFLRKLIYKQSKWKNKAKKSNIIEKGNVLF
jgi:calcium-translocating P-type ATPase